MLLHAVKLALQIGFPCLRKSILESLPRDWLLVATTLDSKVNTIMELSGYLAPKGLVILAKAI